MSSRFHLKDMGSLKRALPRIPGPASTHPLRRIAAKLRAKVAGGGRGKHTPSFPIQRLPEELLAEVFSWVIAYCCQAALWDSYSFAFYDYDDEHSSHPGKCPKAPYAWLKIRHVCHYWRRIALSHPQLSATIFLTRPECVEDMLRRSGTLPLDVYDPSVHYIDTHSETVAASRLMVLEHIARIRHGSFAYSKDPNGIDWVDSLDPGSRKTCNARSLELLSMDDGYPAYSSLSTIHLPNLQKLSCFYYDVTIPGQLLHAPQLRTLHLMNCTNPIAADELLRLLASLPTLEEASLIQILLESEDFPHFDTTHHPPSPNTTHLPSLHHLALCTRSAAAGLAFLRRLAHPPHTALDLRFTELSAGAHAACGCVAAALRATCAAWAALDAPYARLAVTCPRTPEDAFWLELWPAASRSPAHPAYPETHARTRPFFRLAVWALHAHPLVFTHLLYALPHAHAIASARFAAARTGWSVGSWARLLRALPGVERLEVGCEVVGRGVLAGLGGAGTLARKGVFGRVCKEKRGSRVSEGQGTLADAPLVCPQLRELRVEAVRVPRWRWRAARAVREAGGLAELVRVLGARGAQELGVEVMWD